MQPQPVNAQKARAKEGVRIAVCDIERASKASTIFAQKKTAWDNAQKELERQRNQIEIEFSQKSRELQRKSVDPNAKQEELANEAAYLEVLKKKMEDSQREHEVYLTRMLTTYQNDVLKKVRGEMETVAKNHGYDIVLQDYTLDETSAGQFFDGSFAQTLLNKPVLYVPDLENNKNLYVTDITAEVIKKLQ
jgi:Skp family chaperone for outer membrane proteins